MKKSYVCLLALILSLSMLFSGCKKDSGSTTSDSQTQTTTSATTTAAPVETTTAAETTVAPTPVPEKVYSPELLPEERESITLGLLSPEHEFYGEVTTLDPECANYIQELSIYDAEINDTFVVHISLPPNYEEGQKYPMVVMTDGVWRLSDHPELRPMMVDGEIQPVILVSVGYPNGYDYYTIRERDLINNPESYLHFIVDNLVPYLSENFPVASEDMTLTGHSYGGYWTYYAMYHSDTIGKNLFENYYIGSPSFQASTDSLYIKDYEAAYYERNDSLPFNVYVCVGKNEPNAFIGAISGFVGTMNTREDASLNLKYEIIEGHGHNTVFKPSIRNALLMFYGTETT
ncbi:MAG: enterochelin esterase [Clostridiaceae bacterium]|nr:enterochelin esterase [Clostridiaceae bacterium]